MSIFGEVRGGFPRIGIDVELQDGAETVEFVLDTGFEGELTLPRTYTSRLGGPRSGVRRVSLADGSEARCSLYLTLIDWGGESRLTTVLELDGNPLLGVELLADHHLDISMTEGGEVIVEPE